MNDCNAEDSDTKFGSVPWGLHFVATDPEMDDLLEQYVDLPNATFGWIGRMRNGR